jgi:hypothetical protein
LVVEKPTPQFYSLYTHHIPSYPNFSWLILYTHHIPIISHFFMIEFLYPSYHIIYPSYPII